MSNDATREQLLTADRQSQVHGRRDVRADAPCDDDGHEQHQRDGDRLGQPRARFGQRVEQLGALLDEPALHVQVPSDESAVLERTDERQAGHRDEGEQAEPRHRERAPRPRDGPETITRAGMVASRALSRLHHQTGFAHGETVARK
jgi:hypothetical protein